MNRRLRPSWSEIIDLEWEAELILHDASWTIALEAPDSASWSKIIDLEWEAERILHDASWTIALEAMDGDPDDDGDDYARI